MKTIVDLVEELKEYSLEKDTAAKQAVEANIAPVEADASSASRAYVVGEQLFLNDVLYDVTSPISVGDAIVVNTNITAANKLSADIQTLKNQVTDISEVMGKNGAKNKEPFDINVVKALNTTGTWTGNSYALNGITFAFADDGKVTVSGTASALCSINISGNYDLNGDYIITGCPSGGGISTYSLRIYDSSATVVADDIGEGISFTANNLANCRTNIIVRTNVAISTPIVFAPMIRDSKDPDATYQPYAKTNQQLTQDSVTWDDLSEVGAVNYIYPVNSTHTDSAGVTWTLNSDNSISVSSGGIAPSTGTGFSYRNNNAAFLRGKTVTFKANVTGNTPTYDKLYFAVICRETETGANLVRYDLWPIVGQTEVTFTVPDNTNYVLIGCNIQNGATTAIDCKISPIVSPASYNGDYVPYAKSNKELTEDVSDIAYESLTDYGSSEYTLTEGKMWQTKGVTFLYVAVTCTTVSPIENGNHIQIATIPSKFKKPQFNMYPTICNYRDGSSHIGAQLQVQLNGTIAIRGGEAGARYCGLFSY